MINEEHIFPLDRKAHDECEAPEKPEMENGGTCKSESLPASRHVMYHS